jgi:predicted protein tyrosine phosphatase
MKITVSGVHDFPDLNAVNAVVSIADPGEGRPYELASLGVPVLDLRFHDTDGDPRDMEPEEFHLEQVRFFLAEQQPDWLHVHCFAGVSRSTAVASFALACQHPDWTDAQIVEAVQAVRPFALPNALMLRQIDRLLGRHLKRAWDGALRY